MTTQIPSLGVPRRDRLLQEHIHDPYKTRSKPIEPVVCPICKAVFKHGRWQWADRGPVDSEQVMCEACRRTRDNYPAGLVILSGAFVTLHKAEILNLIRHVEESENAEHPLNRIMEIDDQPDSIRITTADVHLPHRIGDALSHIYRGELTIHYDEEGYFVQVNWSSWSDNSASLLSVETPMNSAAT